jgi:hypothetical protein
VDNAPRVPGIGLAGAMPYEPVDVAALRASATHVPRTPRPGAADLPAPPAPPVPPAHRRRWSPRCLPAAAAIACCAAAGLWLGLGASGAPGGPPPSRTAAAPVAHADWAEVLRTLDSRRDQAFADAEPSVLRKVYAPGSAVLERDAAALERLRDRGLRASGLSLQIVDVGVRDLDAGRVELLVRDRLPAYRLVGRSGAARGSAPGRGEADWFVTVVPAAGTAGEWRIASIRGAGS